MENESIKIERLQIGDLKPYGNNAKTHPEKQVDQIAESIKRFGMIDPIGIWSNENVIVEGHGRLKACEKLGVKEVPVIRLDHLSDEERRAYALAHNQTTLVSGFDVEILRVELSDIKDIDMDSLGFDVEKIMNAEAQEDNYDLKLPKEPRSKTGQIYQLGRHRIMCGDSTLQKDVKRLMGGCERTCSLQIRHTM